MSQVMDNETGIRPWISTVLQESRRLRSMNIHEHANLVQAIMLNFPEIYEEPKAPRLAATVDGEGPSTPAGAEHD